MRRDMVTREVLGTKVTVKVVDPATEVVKPVELVLSGRYTEADSKVMKAASKVLGEGIVIIKVESVESFNKLYGMDTADFVKNAMELDPKTRKPLEETPVPATEEN